MTGTWGRELTAGATTFFAMSYIMFVNPTILNKVGMDPSAVFVATCMVSAVASGFAAIALGTPTALACAMSLNSFIVVFNTNFHVPWPFLLFACGVSSIFVFLCSLTSFRQNVINSLPDQIFIAIKGGIGGMLISVALKGTGDFALEAGVWPAIIFFTIGLGIILAIKFVCAQMRVRSNSQSFVSFLEIADSASFLISILTILTLIRMLAYNVHPLPHAEGKVIFWWQNLFTSDGRLIFTDPDLWLKATPFGIAAFFVMFVDIAGSPIDYLRQHYPDEHMGHRAEAEEVKAWEADVRRGSLKIDSFFNIIASAISISPIVYYAENHAGWQAGGRSGLVPGFTAVAFALFAVLGLLLIYSGHEIIEFIPYFAVIPTIFFVGLTIIASSFASRVSSTGTPADGQHGIASVQQGASNGEYFDYIPAAITTILAARISLDVAIAAGILSYLVVTQFPKAEAPPDHRPSERLSFLYAGAITILCLAIYNNWQAVGEPRITLTPSICMAASANVPLSASDLSAIARECDSGNR